MKKIALAVALSVFPVITSAGSWVLYGTNTVPGERDFISKNSEHQFTFKGYRCSVTKPNIHTMDLIPGDSRTSITRMERAVGCDIKGVIVSSKVSFELEDRLDFHRAYLRIDGESLELVHYSSKWKKSTKPYRKGR